MDVLRKCELEQVVKVRRDPLECRVLENGANFSERQKQRICIDPESDHMDCNLNGNDGNEGPLDLKSIVHALSHSLTVWFEIARECVVDRVAAGSVPPLCVPPPLLYPFFVFPLSYCSPSSSYHWGEH